MKWSDEPLYKRNQTKVNEDKFYDGTLGATARDPSPLLMWWMRESPKRNAGELNEIDIAEIKAAQMGFKNGWSKVKEKEPKLFEDFVRWCYDDAKERLKEAWEKMLALKN